MKVHRIPVNPARGLDNLPSEASHEMRFCNAKEVATLVAHLPERYRAMALVMEYGGLRVGEVTALRRHRLNVPTRTLAVVETLSEVKGHLFTNPPKTTAGRRTVALPAQVMAEVSAHLERHPTTPDGYLFTDPQGGPVRVPAWRRRVWGPATLDAGLGGVRIHDMRHTAVALWIASGANPLEVKKRAGHEKSSFTLDRYGHQFDNADTDRLAGLFVAPPAPGTVTPLRAVSPA